MTRLTWGDRPPMYDLGIDQGVLYLDDTAVPWNGLVSVSEKSVGQVNVDHYFEGNRIHITQETGDFEATISAYTYPDAFAEYNGYSERETYKRFGLSYRTQHGLDDYKLHLIYNVLVRNDTRAWSTMTDRPDPSLFNWDIYGEPIAVPGAEKSVHLTMEIPRDPDAFQVLEDILYGTATTEPRMPDPAELIELYEAATQLRVTYNGDGSYTVSGPDDMVELLPDGRFRITAPSAFILDELEGIFVVHSY